MMLRRVWREILSGKAIYFLLLAVLPAAKEATTEMTATPESSNTTQPKSASACEESTLRILCASIGNTSYVIHIVDAFYGRRNKDNIENCPGGSHENCSAPNALNVVRDMCENQTNCSVIARNNNSFGDPCTGVLKYLKVTYQCLPEGYQRPICPKEKKSGVDWEYTSSYDMAEASCPGNRNPLVRKAYRWCGWGQWNETVDLSQCDVRSEFINIFNSLDGLRVNFSEALAKNLMEKVKNLSQKTDLHGGELSLLTNVMVETIDVMWSKSSNISNSTADKINELTLSSSSHLLAEGARDAWTDLSETEQSVTATRLLVVNEDSSALLVNSIEFINRIRRNSSNIVLQVDVVNVTQSSDKLSFNEDSDNSRGSSETKFQISHQDIKNRTLHGFGRVAFALYDNIEMWLGSRELDNETMSPVNSDTATPGFEPSMSLVSAEPDKFNDNVTKRVINTKIISASIITKNQRPTSAGGVMNKGVEFTLDHKENKLTYSNATCVFWDYSRDNFKGHWSSEGCETLSTDAKRTKCKCYHLTNFAVLMTVSNHQMSEADKFALAVITYIGCTISIICLVLAFATFCAFRNLQCDRNTIHKNLVLCLLISEIIFVIGIGLTGNKILCSVIAGFLHYFFLASFTWMLMEGVQLYVLLIEVFEAEKPRAMWYYLAGYGVPAIIVSISAAVHNHDYGAHAEYCWLKPELIWTFVGPVIFIILANSIMLGVAIYMMCKHASTAPSWKMKEKSKLERIGSWLRGAAILVVLLGTTWIFCVFYVNGHTVFMAYIFTILNTLQGLFIFIFHCATNDKVQKEYRRAIQRSNCIPERLKPGSGGGIGSTPNPSSSSSGTLFRRLFPNKKQSDSVESSSCNKSVSSSSDSKNNRVLVIISPPGEAGPKLKKIKRHVSSTSESARLTESSGFGSHESESYLETTEGASGYLEPVITQVDENEFNLPDICDSSAMDSSICMDYVKNHSTVKTGSGSKMT